MVMSAMVQLFSFGEKQSQVSPNENICTIIRILKNHYLFYIKIKNIFLAFTTLNKLLCTGKRQFGFDCALSCQMSP